MSQDLYDVVVLGGGAGGVPAAIRASQLGGKVAMVECNNLGGFCMNRGCIPFGHMMVASNILRSLSLGGEMGLAFTGISKDYGALMKRQNELIEYMRLGVSNTLSKNKVEIIEGRGKIGGKGRLEVNGKAISYKHIILATGSTWVTPEFAGADLEEVTNSDQLLNGDKLPQRVLLYGRSPWNSEIAQFLHIFGSKVILATPDKALLSNESKTITSRLKKALKEEGIDIKTKAEIVSATKEKDGIHVELASKVGGETVLVDKVLHTERAACLRDIGLETISLEVEAPHLQVNDKMETSVEGVYAIGDITGPQSRHYSHLSSEGGVIAAENAMGHDAVFNPRTLTRILFTQPQVACVGLTPKEAKSQGYEVLVGAAPYSMNPFGMILSENEGIVEVVAEKKYGELLGVHMIGKAASEMAGQAVIAIQMEGTLKQLSKAPFPHPTLSESLAEAARDALDRPIYLP